MTTPTFTAPPTAPSRSDLPATFITRANAFIAWFATLYAELVIALGWIADQATAIVGYAASAAANATTATTGANAAVNATTLFDTSASSLSPSASAKAVTYASAGRTFANGDDIWLIRASDPTIRMHGAASSVNNGAKTMTVTVGASGFTGSGGPYTDWMVIHGSLVSLIAGAASDLLAASNSILAITCKGVKDALAPFALTDAATVSPDGHSGLDFTWTIGGNRTLGAITNTYPGARGSIKITQDGTGSRILAWASGVYKRRGGLPVLSTAPGAVDWLEYKVRAVDGSNTATDVTVTFTKGPTN